MSRAFIGLGSNLNEPERQVRSALEELASLPDTTLRRHSSLYSSLPVGPQDQPPYVNAVAELETELPPLDLLSRLQALESAHGRVRAGRRWGPRPLDLDILLYDELSVHDGKLVIPHPEIGRRNFVLAPLSEIAADVIIPGVGPAHDALEKVGRDGLELLSDHG